VLVVTAVAAAGAALNREERHMKIATRALAAATLAMAGVLGIANAAPAPADYPLIQEFGTEEVLVDGAGTIIQGWTIDNLEPSMDIIGWPVRGRLWEADATVRAIRGTATPIVSNFNAVAHNGNTYQHLWAAVASQGVNPSTIGQGGETTGKLYFDVWGLDPDSVVYIAAGRNLLIWVK
jgi:hypothetical protein